MSLNSSLNGSLLPAPLSSGSSSLNVYLYCLTSKPSFLVFMTVHINIIFLILPLCVFILQHGVRKRLRKPSSSSSAAAGHSDIFTYHMIIMELTGVFGYILSLIGILYNNLTINLFGSVFTSCTWFGQIFFHILTCVERYLAVVHPIIYLGLKSQRVIRNRNLLIGCVWLLSITGMGLMMFSNFYFILDFSLLALALMIIAFCSISVLHVLIRPHPGQRGDGRGNVDRSKRRSFFTIVAILGVVGARIAFNVVWEVIFITGSESHCVLMAICVWFNIPSSLVLPLLFLHRAGKFECCRKRIKPGEDKDLQSGRTSHKRPKNVADVNLKGQTE